MPDRKIPRALRAAALVALCSLAPAVDAQADVIETSLCDDAPLSQPFAPWGDHAYYKIAPGGDVEGSLSGSTVAGGAKKVSGSEPYAVTGKAGSSSLGLPAGSSATTPGSCVNASYPSLRFFAKSSGGLLGLVPVLKVDLVYRDGLLGLVSVPAGTVVPSSSWKPSGQMLTLSPVGAAVAGGEAPLSIRFTAVSGSWQVDDIHIDPYRKG